MRGFWIIALGGLLAAGGAAAQDIAEGRQVAGMCRTCHGIEGKSRMPLAPNIGGEPAGYLAAQLEAFRSGERVNEMMSVIAASLSDQQIADVTAWYAAQQAHATLPAGASEDDAPELCAGCHGADGIALLPDAPNLAGESAIYLQTQLDAFRSGARISDVMTPIAQALPEGGIRDVLAWFEAIDLEIESPQ